MYFSIHYFSYTSFEIFSKKSYHFLFQELFLASLTLINLLFFTAFKFFVIALAFNADIFESESVSSLIPLL